MQMRTREAYLRVLEMRNGGDFMLFLGFSPSCPVLRDFFQVLSDNLCASWNVDWSLHSLDCRKSLQSSLSRSDTIMKSKDGSFQRYRYPTKGEMA